jgi:hypothetical protein
MKVFKYIIVIIILSCVYFSCRKEDLITENSAMLAFSIDTVTFDTIFTSIGSTTKNFRAYNPYSQPINISEIYLAGGENSVFRLNIDGDRSGRVKNIEIPSKDSLYIFVEVTIDPFGVNNPVIVKDSIVFITNGNYQDIKLIAFGQDVHLINGEITESNNWIADKPYLIYNSMAVDTDHVLTIEEGTLVYLHNRSSIVIWGRLQINGTKENPVIFQGDRIDEQFYDSVAGQWGTIFIDPISVDNEINYAIIKNSIAGIQIGHPTDNNIPSLELRNTIIQNVSFVGIYAFGAKITAYNTIIADSKDYCVTLLKGGDYNFYHCTINNRGLLWEGRSSEHSVVITNEFDNPEIDSTGTKIVYVKRKGDLEEANFVNCIINGNKTNELQFRDNGENIFNYKFDHCIIKENPDSVDSNNPEHFSNIIFNKDPGFINDFSRSNYDFQLDTLSPAKNMGTRAIIDQHTFLEYDFNGNSRTNDEAPDIGAFERIEE